MWTSAFWKDAVERAIKGFAGTLVALLGAGATNLLEADWVAMLGVSGMAFVVSILTSVGSAKTGTKGTAQLGVSDKTSYGY